MTIHGRFIVGLLVCRISSGMAHCFTRWTSEKWSGEFSGFGKIHPTTFLRAFGEDRVVLRRQGALEAALDERLDGEGHERQERQERRHGEGGLERVLVVENLDVEWHGVREA